MKQTRRSRAQSKRLLADLLADQPKDEKAGAHAFRGFSFQQWWATFRVVDLLATNAPDFAVAMEVKEDVAVLDSATAPTRVEFCQVKKNERGKNWSLKTLHAKGQKRADGSRDRSVLSKLYGRRRDFLGHSTKLSFVSNALVDAAFSAGFTTPSACALDALPEDVQKTVRSKIAEELGLKPEEIDLSDFALESTDLPIGRPELQVTGRLMQACESGALPISIAKPTAVACMLASEIQKRSRSTNFARTLPELQARMLTRSQALDVIAAVAEEGRPTQEILEEACARLDSELHDFRVVRAIRKRAAAVVVHSTDRTNTHFWQLAGEMVARLDEAQASSGSDQLGALMTRLVELAIQGNPATATDRGYLNGLALLVIYEGILLDAQTLAAGEKPEDEE